MSNSAVSSLTESGMESGGRYMVMHALAHYLRDPEPGDPDSLKVDEVKISRATIGVFARLGDRQVKRVLKELREAKPPVIEVTGAGGNGAGDANVYRLHFLDIIETTGYACKQARRKVFAGVGKAIEAEGLRGCEATVENMQAVIEVLSDVLIKEGHEGLAKRLRALVDLPEGEGGQNVPHNEPENKGDILSGRGTFATNKGDIWCKKHLILDSIECPSVRASAREAWGILGRHFETKGFNSADIAKGDFPEGVLGLEYPANEGQELIGFQFPSAWTVDRFVENYSAIIREAWTDLSVGVVLCSRGSSGHKFGGQGMLNLQDLADQGIARQALEAAESSAAVASTGQAIANGAGS